VTLELALRLCLVFGTASLLSFGGGNAIVPQLQLETVGTYGWLTAGQFADSFAIAQAAPGPSTLLVSLLGYDAAGLAGNQRNGAAACVRYLENKREFLRYDQALEAGWPIATGVIEGACRHLIADRLNLGGARWGLDGAEAVLTLRAVISNGDFEEYWRFHLACEHERLYPGTDQGKYALGA